MAGKRISFASMAGAPVVPVPGREDPHQAPLEDIAFNPDNPRDPEEFQAEDFGEMKASLEEVGQLQPVLVASRKVYLTHFPHHADAVGAAKWVVLGGNRRLEAARQLGWSSLDIKVRDDLGAGEGSLDEAVMIENIHRKNLAPLREAEFLQRMVERHGSQGKVAKRIGKTQAYVSQRLALLRLAPELKEALESGELKVRQARELAGAGDAEQQLTAWKQAPEPETDPVVVPAPADEATAHNRVMGEGALSAGPAAHNPVMTDRTASVEPPRRERASSPSPAVLVRQLGETPAAIADTLRKGMEAGEFEELVEILADRL
ncbi:hypothetical protein GCM10010406_52380 [Streptomyces thermolineatus]|uniref:ParB-like N-terminal domain-containing protein n=1 Tax=Streptomyces thermolineatus TaxID=44033 RepID=A0ABP6A2B7_9ACTN